jgi:tetratricopeptide (TPR) repeat protein
MGTSADDSPDSEVQRLRSQGHALRVAGRLNEAIGVFQELVDLRPDRSEAHNDLGNVLLRKGEHAKAIASLNRALALDSGNVDAWINLGNGFSALRQYAEAADAYRRALELRPNHGPVYANLANALWKSGELPEAADACRRAIAIQPDYAPGYTNLANIVLEEGRIDEAIAVHRQALKIAPDHPAARFNLGIALLQNGDFKEGWKEYEWRLQDENFSQRGRKFSQPVWDGSDLAGLRILFHPQQGFGDIIQFSRFVPLVAQRNGKVILESPEPLSRLLRTLDGVHEWIEEGDELPAFDVHCSLLSLPFHLDITLQNLPGKVPYLGFDPRRAEYWQRRMNPKSNSLKIGLVWAGNPSHLNDNVRSIHLSQLAPLAQNNRAQFYSLQKGAPGGQVRDVAGSFTVADLTPDLVDFADTAALIANLDLVIGVDTSVVHLAGALGKQVWVLLPLAPDWRWMMHRSDSPWYPTMRLFRQQKRGDWQTPVREMAEALRGLDVSAFKRE